MFEPQKFYCIHQLRLAVSSVINRDRNPRRHICFSSSWLFYVLFLALSVTDLYSRELKTLHLKFGIQGFYNIIMTLIFYIYLSLQISNGFHVSFLFLASFTGLYGTRKGKGHFFSNIYQKRS